MSEQDYGDREIQLVERAVTAVKPVLEELVRLVVDQASYLGTITSFMWATGRCPDNEDDEYVVDTYVIEIYEGLTEVVGGAADGKHITTGMVVQLQDVYRVLEPLDDLPVRLEFDTGLEFAPVALYLSGSYKGLPVTIMVLLGPPEGEKPSTCVNAHGETWPHPSIGDTDESDP